MLAATTYAAPHELDVIGVLQLQADLLFGINALWLRRMLARGLHPPLRALQCTPPWCARRVQYITHRGLPLGKSRDYYDGPMMFEDGAGTCIEISSYDAAASSVMLKIPARPLVVGELPNLHCVVRYDSGRTFDPTAEVTPWSRP